MKTLNYLLPLAVIAGVALLAAFSRTQAQAPTPAPGARFEVAVVKWNGPDRIQLITPQSSQMLRVYQEGPKPPRDIDEEEFCLAWGANRLAAEGWEPVNLNSRRILLRRPISAP